MNKSSGIAAVALAHIIWGFSTPALKIALDEIPPFSAIFIRFTIASLLILPIYFVREKKRLSKDDLLILFLLAFFGVTLHISFFVLGLNMTSVVAASLIIASSPIIDSVMAAAFLKEKISNLHKLGIFLGFVGALLLIFRPVPAESTPNSLVGNIFILLAILLGGVFMVGTKKIDSRFNALTITTSAFVACALCFLPFSIVETFINPSWVFTLSWKAISAIVFSGIFASFTAYLLFDWGLVRTQVQIVSALTYLTPIVSIAIGVLVLNETLDTSFLIAGAIIVIAVYLSTLRKPHHHIRHHHRV